ncbi:hypothetical protein Hanom_Chr08g00691071 [Helianthus anomalus]
MARFQTFWIQMWRNKPSDESRKTSQTSGTKWHFTLKYITNKSSGSLLLKVGGGGGCAGSITPFESTKSSVGSGLGSSTGNSVSSS